MLKKLSLLIILLTCYLINPEIIILENGKIIDGKIIKMDEDTMTVITKNKEIVIDRDAIIQTFRSMEDYNKFKKSTESNNKIIEKGSLIAEWLFNGNANDTSGNELHGKVFGSKSLVEDRFGNKDSAYEFGVGKTKLIRVDKNISILQRQKFSISLWIKIKKYSNWAEIFDLYKWHSKMGYHVGIGSADSLNFSFWLRNGISKGITTETKLVKDIWYHMVSIYDNNVTKIYLNGKIENQDATTAINHARLNEVNLYIGAAGSNDPMSFQFYGCIDDIRFYDYALSEEEIKELYHENGWPK